MLQASLAQIEGQPAKLPKDPYLRQRFDHPALRPADALLNPTRRTLLHKKRVTGLAEQYGLPEVLRWLPKRVRLELDHLFFSGSLQQANNYMFSTSAINYSSRELNSFLRRPCSRLLVQSPWKREDMSRIKSHDTGY
jgi:hypothetical protein